MNIELLNRLSNLTRTVERLAIAQEKLIEIEK